MIRKSMSDWTPKNTREKIVGILANSHPIPGYEIYQKMTTCPKSLFKSQLHFLVSKEQVIGNGTPNKLRYRLPNKHALALNRTLWREHNEPSFRERREHYGVMR